MSLSLAQETLRTGVEWLRLVVEGLGALAVAAGLAHALLAWIRALAQASGSYHTVRLTLARYLTLALELQLAADILSTSIAPTWAQIGQLAAIAVIRTGLNYFLNMEIENETGSPQRDAGHTAEPGGHP